MQYKIITTSFSALLLICGSSTSFASNTNTAEIDLQDIIQYSLKPDCLEYIFERIWLRVGITISYPPQIRYALSFEVSYYQPDAIVMLYNKIGEEPILEWQQTMSRALKTIENPIMNILFKTPPNGNATVSPWQAATAGRFVYKYVDIIGSPIPIVLNRLSTDRNNMSKYFSSDDDEIGEKFDQSFASEQELASLLQQSVQQDDERIAANIRSSSAKYLDIVKGKAEQIKRYFDLNATSDAMETIKKLGSANQVLDQNGRLGEYANKYNDDLNSIKKSIQSMYSGNGMNPFSDDYNFFCPSSVVPFDLYFLSVLNPIGWRMGLPDSIGINAWNVLDSSQVIGNAINNRWGRLFPRQGFVYSLDENKASAVLATRAIDIIRKDQQKFVYKKISDSRYVRNQDVVTHRKWQMLYPTKSDQCSAFVESSKKTLPAAWGENLNKNAKKRYVYQYWRKYRCELNPVFFRFLPSPPLNMRLHGYKKR